MSGGIRDFGAGAVRNGDQGKLDYEGALSPAVLERYVAYLASHRELPDGSLRDFDNWQAGIPTEVYMKSALRHFMDLWKLHRGLDAVTDGKPVDLEDAACAVLFNVMGYLFETIRARRDGDTHEMLVYRTGDVQWARGGFPPEKLTNSAKAGQATGTRKYCKCTDCHIRRRHRQVEAHRALLPCGDPACATCTHYGGPVSLGAYRDMGDERGRA